MRRFGQVWACPHLCSIHPQLRNTRGLAVSTPAHLPRCCPPSTPILPRSHQRQVPAALPLRQTCRVPSPFGMPAVWDQLTEVERTAVKVCLYRMRAARLLPNPEHAWDDSFDRALVADCMPAEAQAAALTKLEPDMLPMIGVRTAELDQQLLTAVTSSPSLRQVLLLGAGLDPRAWRLAWPPATHVWEVDSGSVEGVKLRALAAMPCAAAGRRFVRADLSKAKGGGGDGAGGGLAAALRAEGWEPEAPSLWLLEGLIGYLTREEAAELLHVLYECSAPGSVLVMTCPPTPVFRAYAEARGHALHHHTFEEAEETAARVAAAGWSSCQLLSAASLGEKYGVPSYLQAMITAHK